MLTDAERAKLNDWAETTRYLRRFQIANLQAQTEIAVLRHHEPPPCPAYELWITTRPEEVLLAKEREPLRLAMPVGAAKADGTYYFTGETVDVAGAVLPIYDTTAGVAKP